MKQFAIRPVVLAGLLATTTLSAWATDGYFSHGYGMKAKGMGGAAVASTDNAFAGATTLPPLPGLAVAWKLVWICSCPIVACRVRVEWMPM